MATNDKKSTVIKLGPAVGAFAHGLFEAHAMDEKSEPKYGITLLFPKKTADKTLKELRQMIDFCARQKFGANYAKNPKFANPIRDGDLEKPDKKEFAGMLFIAAKSKNRPGLVDRHLRVVTDKEEAYSGCKFVIQAGVFATDKGGTPRVALGLNNAMVFEKGDRIDGRQDAAEAFAEFADGAEGEGGEEENALD